jgi:hypothetical protein
MRKTITAVLLSALVVVGLTAVVSTASDSDRVPSERLQTDTSKIKSRLSEAREHVREAKIRCKSLACINRSITRLARAVNAILNDLNNCEQTRDITQYNDYEQYPDSGPVTGLDYTFPGDAISNRMLVYVC